MPKKKAMTKKEFMGVLEKAGLHFDVYGYEGILNILSLYSDYESKAYENRCPVLAKMYSRYADIIYNELQARGYYDE